MVRLSGCSLLEPSVRRQDWPIWKKVKQAAQNDPPDSLCWKTQGGFFSIHHHLSVRVILSKTMPTADATFAAAPQSTLYHHSPGLHAPALLQRRQQSSFGRKRLPLHSQCYHAKGFPDWALQDLLPANRCEWLLEAERAQNAICNPHSPGTHRISYLHLITSTIYMWSLSAQQQWPLLHNRRISLSSG